MGDVKHTPGPWRIDYNQGDIWIGPHINGGPEVLTVVNMPTRAYAGPALQARIADARLIAAAPDLVEALKAATATCQTFLDDCGDVRDFTTQADINDWEEIISKAEGQ